MVLVSSQARKIRPGPSQNVTSTQLGIGPLRYAVELTHTWPLIKGLQWPISPLTALVNLFNKSGYASTIYILADVELWHRMKDFTVNPRHESDHNSLVLELTFPTSHQSSSDQSVPNLITVEGGRRVRWGTFAQSAEKVATLYKQIIPFLETAFSLTESSYSAELLPLLQKTHHELFSKLADSFCNSGNTRSTSKQKHPWFNKLCRKAKCALL